MLQAAAASKFSTKSDSKESNYCNSQNVEIETNSFIFFLKNFFSQAAL